MKRIEPGKLFEIIANLAVVAGIVFLGIEIRQNTQSLEVNAYQSLVGQVNSFATLVIEKPELELLAQSDTSFDQLSNEDRLRVVGYYYFVTRHGDLAFYQHELGMLSGERLGSSLGPLTDRVCRKLFREFWAQHSHNFAASYRSFVDSRIRECL